jgi:hypothetical protein
MPARGIGPGMPSRDSREESVAMFNTDVVVPGTDIQPSLSARPPHHDSVIRTSWGRERVESRPWQWSVAHDNGLRRRFSPFLHYSKKPRGDNRVAQLFNSVAPSNGPRMALCRSDGTVQCDMSGMHGGGDGGGGGGAPKGWARKGDVLLSRRHITGPSLGTPEGPGGD